jgi:hypothetical protein
VPALANIATADKPRVPAEYRGCARLFRDEVKRIDEQMDVALATISAPLIARLRRRHRLRHELIAGAVKIYRKVVPPAFRFGEIEVHPNRDHFAISECRLTASWINSTTWDSDAHEPGVAVARASLAMRPGQPGQGRTKNRRSVSAPCDRSGLGLAPEALPHPRTMPSPVGHGRPALRRTIRPEYL